MMEMTEAKEDELLERFATEERELFVWLGETIAALGLVNTRERHNALVEFARSRVFSSAGCLMVGAWGWLFREAARALMIDLDSDTPQRRWYNADLMIGRASIVRLLSADADHAHYTTAPFRTWINDGDTSRIAAAVHCPRWLNRQPEDTWDQLDIPDVLLWEPRLNSVMVAGDHPSRHLCRWADG